MSIEPVDLLLHRFLERSCDNRDLNLGTTGESVRRAGVVVNGGGDSLGVLASEDGEGGGLDGVEDEVLCHSIARQR